MVQGRGSFQLPQGHPGCWPSTYSPVAGWRMEPRGKGKGQRTPPAILMEDSWKLPQLHFEPIGQSESHGHAHLQERLGNVVPWPRPSSGTGSKCSLVCVWPRTQLEILLLRKKGNGCFLSSHLGYGKLGDHLSIADAEPKVLGERKVDPMCVLGNKPLFNPLRVPPSCSGPVPSTLLSSPSAVGDRSCVTAATSGDHVPSSLLRLSPDFHREDLQHMPHNWTSEKLICWSNFQKRGPNRQCGLVPQAPSPQRRILRVFSVAPQQTPVAWNPTLPHPLPSFLHSCLIFLTPFPCDWAGKESTCNAGDLGLIPRLGRSPGEGKGYPLQYSGLENSMDCTVHGVTKSWTWLNDFHLPWSTPCTHVLIPESVFREPECSHL